MIIMRKSKLLTTVILIFTLISCGGNSSTSHPATADGFSKIEKEIKNKFGDNAYFTDLTIAYSKTIGNIINVTATDTPESLKMGEWNQIQGTWKQNSAISLEVPVGSKAANFMFQLNENINLSKLGELVESSSKELTAKKGLKNPMLYMAMVKFPDNGNLSKTEYTVMLKAETGGTTFTFSYNLNGELIKMDY